MEINEPRPAQSQYRPDSWRISSTPIRCAADSCSPPSVSPICRPSRVHCTDTCSASSSCGSGGPWCWAYPRRPASTWSGPSCTDRCCRRTAATFPGNEWQSRAPASSRSNCPCPWWWWLRCGEQFDTSRSMNFVVWCIYFVFPPKPNKRGQSRVCVLGEMICGEQ